MNQNAQNIQGHTGSVVHREDDHMVEVMDCEILDGLMSIKTTALESNSVLIENRHLHTGNDAVEVLVTGIADVDLAPYVLVLG